MQVAEKEVRLVTEVIPLLVGLRNKVEADEAVKALAEFSYDAICFLLAPGVHSDHRRRDVDTVLTQNIAV